jgi:hypothetical protein
MHPARARETTLAGRLEAKCGVVDIDRLVGNGVWAYNDATPLIFNDVGHDTAVRAAILRGRRPSMNTSKRLVAPAAARMRKYRT